jgi:hypothetical protein
MIIRLYTRNASDSRLGIEIWHLTIHLPGETDCLGDVTETGDACSLIFTGDHADTDFFAPDAHTRYHEEDLYEGNDHPAPGQSIEDFLEAEHQAFTRDGWVLLPHDFGVSDTASRIIARSYELAKASL